VSKYIAKMVYKQAIIDGVTPEVSDEDIGKAIDRNFWRPSYRPYRRNSL
jgi:malate dehydrogenase (oxaloacetate-decarboxylating)